MSVPDRRKVTDAVLTLVAAGTGRPCGDHKAPAVDTSLDASWPYAVVYSISGGGYWGAPLVAPDGNADFVYQVDSLGLRRDQAEWLADAARRTMLARSSSGAFQVALTPPAGWAVADREPQGGAGGVQVSDPVLVGDKTVRVFSVAERFVIRVVAA